MTVSISAIKKNSKIILKDNISVAFFVFLLCGAAFLIDGILSSLLMSAFGSDAIWGVLSPARLPLLFSLNNLVPTILMLIFRLFVLMPVVLGVIRWFWRMINKKEDTISSVLFYYGSISNFRRAINISVVFGGWVTLIGFISMLAYYLVAFVSSDWVYESLSLAKPEMFANGVLVGFVLLVCRVLFTYLVFRVVCFIPLAVIMEDKTPKDVFAATIKIFAEFTGCTFVLFLSFFGWIALSVLIVPLIFAGPYFITCVVLFVKYAVNNYNLKYFPDTGI